MLRFKKLTLFTAFIALILGFSITSTYAQTKDKAEKPDKHLLKGKVVDAESGEALSKVKVNIVGKEKADKTNKKGTFTFNEIQEGNHTIKVKEKGYKIWKNEVKVTEDSRLTIEVQPVK